MNLDEIIEQLTETILYDAIDTNEVGGMSCQQFFAMQHQQKREFLRQKYIEGMRFHGLTETEHDELMASIFAFVDAEVEPKVTCLLHEMGKAKGKPPEWAPAVASRVNSKKTGRTMREQADHPIINDLREGSMYSPTHKGALQKATYIGKAALLFSGSQQARRMRKLEQQLQDNTQRIKALELAAGDAKARLASVEDWQEKAEAMSKAGSSYGAIADALGRSKSTVSTYLMRKKVKQ